jgi:hypothetical protein
MVIPLPGEGELRAKSSQAMLSKNGERIIAVRVMKAMKRRIFISSPYPPRGPPLKTSSSVAILRHWPSFWQIVISSPYRGFSGPDRKVFSGLPIQLPPRRYRKKACPFRSSYLLAQNWQRPFMKRVDRIILGIVDYCRAPATFSTLPSNSPDSIKVWTFRMSSLNLRSPVIGGTLSRTTL